MTREYEQYIMTIMLMYTMMSDIKAKTPKVSKYGKHIRLYLIKLRERDGDLYQKLLNESHNKFEEVKKELVPIESMLQINQGMFHTTLYSGLRGNKYITQAFTQATIDNAIQSFYGCTNDEIVEYDQNSVKMAKLFLEKIGIKQVNRLARMRIINEQNLVLEQG